LLYCTHVSGLDYQNGHQDLVVRTRCTLTVRSAELLVYFVAVGSFRTGFVPRVARYHCQQVLRPSVQRAVCRRR